MRIGADQKYRADIDGLRAIAVLSVIGFHAFPSLIKGGFVGVDVFFVISGFLISSIIFSRLETDSFSYADFYARRIKRIFPALILVLISCIVFGWFVLPPDEYRQLGKHIAFGAAFISNFALWSESGYFDSSADTKPLLHLWSLGIEEQFYIVWPVLLGLVWKRRWNFLTLTVAIAIASFATNIFTVGSEPVVAFYSPISRFWELMVGGILAYLILHKPQHLARMPNWQSAIGISLIAIAVLTLNKTSLFPGWWALLPTGGAFLVISAGSTAWPNRHLLGNPILVWIGLISYPLYLWHWPILYVLNNHHLVSPINPPSLFWTLKIVAIIICFLLAQLTYKFFELPVRLNKISKTTTLLVCSLIVLGAVGFSLIFSNGYESRFPNEISKILSYKFNSDEEYRRGTCFLEITKDKSKFSDCTSSPVSNEHKSLLLWGDSHAAHLYPGLKFALGSTSAITQLNTGNCPPVLGHAINGSPNCRLNNEFVAEQIKRSKPTIVLLSAGWIRYDYWRDLTRTIAFLKELGIDEIVLIGPAPQWSGSLPRQIFENYRANKEPVPAARFRVGLNEKISPLDVEMGNFANRMGIRYISLHKILCDERGCLTRLGSSPDTLTAFDYDHFTTIGSQYVVTHFPAWFFNTLTSKSAVMPDIEHK